ncbi:hypothetical protein A2U01_0068590, partial [Trifolium medium]|nr:hypothetical protein [Trifolium medium]
SLELLSFDATATVPPNTFFLACEHNALIHLTLQRQVSIETVEKWWWWGCALEKTVVVVVLCLVKNEDGERGGGVVTVVGDSW